ncbi:hypothetical protein O0L34_g12487 [Tuta absoluta]|nr:hypothetical protein O0L34_g12487 [Tuta absoluta]
MRAAAMSVWVFLNLLCFGMCGYLYLIWSQYWMYIEKQRLFNKAPATERSSLTGLSFEKKFSYNAAYNASTLRMDSVRKRSAIGSFWSNGKPGASNNVVRKDGSPRFPNIHKPVLEFDSEKYLCDDLYSSDCETRSAEFKDVLLKEFHRVLMGESKVFRSGLDVHNTYNVKYDRKPGKEMSRLEAMCALQKIAVRTVGPDDEPFKGLGYRIPRQPLRLYRAFNTCAVVTSAGALLGSHLGEFIDSHDMVLRFNNAPTENYTDDVGAKTTFRVLNSQVVTKPEFHFPDDPLYMDVSVLIWDPANYSSTLEDWYNHPDFPLFPVYKKLLEDKLDADVHLLHPKVLWDLWEVLQDSSPYRLRRNPPSSGFLGVWFSMHRCKRVRVFEYVPSARATRRCHYHATHDDTSCTLGAWHPLAQEKALAERLRDNSDVEVFQRGYVDIPGLSSVVCPN